MPAGRKPTVDIEVVTLDSMIGDRRPDLLKLDTQGSEVGILDGGRRAWAPRPGSVDPVIVLEFWPYGLQHCGTSVARLIAQLAELIDVTHRCFEIVEWRTALDRLSLVDLERMVTVGGYCAEMKGVHRPAARADRPRRRDLRADHAAGLITPGVAPSSNQAGRRTIVERCGPSDQAGERCPPVSG